MCNLVVLIFILCFLSIFGEKPANSVDFKLTNLAGKPIEVFWVDTFSAEERLVSQSKKPIRNNTDIVIHSYATHKFSVRFLKHIEHSEANFTKLPKDEVIRVTFDKERQKLVLEQATKYNEGVTILRDAVKECEQLTQLSPQSHDTHDCIAKKALTYAREFTESRDTMNEYRDSLSERLRNYTCFDPKMPATEPIRSYEYFFLNERHIVDVLFDQDSSKIWTIQDFITEDECEYFENYARPNLSRATVAGDDGKSVISLHRRAQQAGYDFDPKTLHDDPLWPLYDRILHVVNHHSHYNLRPEGQEGFTVIQYGVNDEYMPHCDGSCDGLPYRKYGRVATAIVYCQVPELGGGTTFTNADVFVRPKAGQAVFFSYKGKSGIMDEKLTEHSGCPVLQGEKWIATAWLREGVSEEEPSTNFDPDGVPVFNGDGDESVEEEAEEDDEYIGISKRAQQQQQQKKKGRNNKLHEEL